MAIPPQVGHKVILPSIGLKGEIIQIDHKRHYPYLIKPIGRGGAVWYGRGAFVLAQDIPRVSK